MPVLCDVEVLLLPEQAVKTARHPSAIARVNAIYFFVCFKVFPPFFFVAPEVSSDGLIVTPAAKAVLKLLVESLWKLFFSPKLVSSAVRLMNCA